MHETQRWRLVCYDIRDVQRYRRAHRLLKGYGEPVQYSIFRCRLDDRRTAELRWALAQILDSEDSLLIVDLCHSCAGRVVSQNHKAGWDAPPPTFAIALGKSALGDGSQESREDKVSGAGVEGAGTIKHVRVRGGRDGGILHKGGK